jgi:hypothetical protein
MVSLYVGEKDQIESVFGYITGILSCRCATALLLQDHVSAPSVAALAMSDSRSANQMLI